MPSTPVPIQNPHLSIPGYSGQPAPVNWNVAPSKVPGVAGPPRMPVPAALAAGTTNPTAPPRPTIRLQAPDTPPARPFAPLVLPSPEALGIRVSNPVPVAVPSLDWNTVHARLQRLGALGFHLDRLAQGGLRVTFMLPAGGQSAHQIEVVADTEAAAVGAALEHAEAWSSGRK